MREPAKPLGLVERVVQRRHRAAKPPRQPGDLPHAPVDQESRLLEAERRARFKTMRQAAEHLGYEGPRAAHSAYVFLTREGVTLHRRGRCVVVRVADLEDVVTKGRSEFVDRALAGRR